MLEMSRLAGAEADDLLIVRDIIHFSYELSYTYRNIWMYVFSFLYIVPFVAQLIIGDHWP